jgi:predicted SAM-dependent methyltransferase
MKLHIGCGKRLLDDFINIDVRLNRDLHETATEEGYFIEELPAWDLPYQDESVSYILCEHMLEHLYPERAHETLWEFARLLKPNEGVLEIAVPNFKFFAKNFDEYEHDTFKARNVMYAILCNVSSHPMSNHQSLWWRANLEKLLLDVGISDCHIIKEDSELRMKGKKSVKRVVDVYK